MKAQLEALIAAAKQWSDYTRKDGRGHKKYCDEYVNSYHATDSDHRQVTFGKYPNTLEITFNSPPAIRGTTNSFACMEEITSQAMMLLEDAQEAYSRKSDDEKEAEKKARIAALKKQLDEELSA